MPKPDSRRQPALLASNSRRPIADHVPRYFIQRIRRRDDSRKPDARTNIGHRWRASRSRSPRRRDSEASRMAPDLRPSRRRAKPSRAASSRTRRPVPILRIIPPRGRTRKRASLRKVGPKTPRNLRMAPSRSSAAGYRRARERNPVGQRTSASEQARPLQKQHTVRREQASDLDGSRFARRRNLQPTPPRPNPNRDRPIHRMRNLDTPTMDSSRKAHPALLPLQT